MGFTFHIHQGVSALAQLTCGAGQFLMAGPPNTCVPGYSAASLASAHQMPAAFPPPQALTTQNVCRHCRVLGMSLGVGDHFQFDRWRKHI